MSSDPYNYKILMQKILLQALDDYVRLQHPKQRRKKYLQEAWLSAVDLIFDPTYEMQIKNLEGHSMTLKDVVEAAYGASEMPLNALKTYVVKEASSYWSDQQMSVIKVPTELIVDNTVFTVIYKNIENLYELDADKYQLVINAQATENNKQKAIIAATISYSCLTQNISLSDEEISRISDTLFETIKMNELTYEL